MTYPNYETTACYGSEHALRHLQRLQRQILGALFVGYFLYTALRLGLKQVAPDMQAAGGLRLGIADIGQMYSTCSLAYGASKFIASILTDFMSCRHLFVLGLAAAGGANIAMAASGSAGVLTLVWGLNGVVQGFGWPSLSAIIIAWFPPHRRGSVWSVCTVAGNLAKTLMPTLIAFAVAHGGWRAAFYMPGAVGLCSAASLLVVLRESPEAAGLPPQLLKEHFRTTPSILSEAKPTYGPQVQSIVEKPGSGVAAWVLVAQSVDFWVLAISDVFVYFVLQGFSDWTPLYLTDAHGMSHSAAALGLFWYEIGGICSTFTSGFLSDWLRGNRNLTSFVYSCCLVPALAGLPLLASTTTVGPVANTVIVYGCFLLIGIGTYGPKTMCGLEARERHMHAGGAAGALLGLLGQLGAAAAGWPLTQAHAIGGWGLPGGVMGGLSLASFLAMLGFGVLVLRGKSTGKRRRSHAKGE